MSTDAKSGKIDYARDVVVFLSWTLTSFLAHYMTKSYLRVSEGHVDTVFLVTIFQVALLLSMLKFKNNENKHFVILIGVLSHVISVLTTNYSLSLMYAASTLTVKMLEPVTSSLLQRLVLPVSIPWTAFISVPLIVFGAILFTGDPFQNPGLTKGVTLALVSNVALGTRNTAVKIIFEANLRLEIRSVQTVVIVLSCVLSITSIAYKHGFVTSPEAATVILASFSHGISMYLSLGVVLRSVSILTHAVLNIFKRVVVVLLLCVFGNKVLNLVNAIGLALAAVGLVIFAWSKTPSTHGTASNDQRSFSQFTKRMATVLLFVCAALTVVDLRQMTQVNRYGLLGNTGNTSVFHSSKSRLQESPQIRQVSPLDTFFRSLFHSSNEKTSLPMSKASSEVSESDTSMIAKRNIFLKTPGHNFQEFKNMDDVINESQKIQFTVFTTILGSRKYVILVDMAGFENKGDAAIGVGELLLLKRLGKQLLFYCRDDLCTEDKLKIAKESAVKLGRDNVTVLCHGGGNIVGYTYHDQIRERVFKTFYNDVKIVVFPQSILVFPWSNGPYSTHMYAKYPDVIVMIRDKQSMERGKVLLPMNQLVLAPDMAFQIGPVARVMSPLYDVIWLRRKDDESAVYRIPKFSNVTVKAEDWLNWEPTETEDLLERIHLITNIGLTFLQRGRVVITDRLHGHILSTLLHIPHVLLDTSDHKLAAYHNTWTKELEGKTVLTAKSPQDALRKAIILLNRFREILPEKATDARLKETVPMTGFN